MTESLRELDYIETWVCCVICGVVGGAVLGAIVGAILGISLPQLGASVRGVRITATVVSEFLGLAASYEFFRLFVELFIVRKLTLRPASVSGPNAA